MLILQLIVLVLQLHLFLVRVMFAVMPAVKLLPHAQISLVLQMLVVLHWRHLVADCIKCKKTAPGLPPRG